MQKLLLPLSILIAGGLIAGTILFVNTKTPATNTLPTNTVKKEVRTVQNNDHILGSPKAKLVIIEYSDTECPYCKVFHETLQKVIAEYGNSSKVAWVYRHFPIPQLHPKAAKEAEALECAAAQGGNDMFWKYTDAIYAKTTSNNSLDIGVYNDPETAPSDASGKPYYTQKTPRSTTDAGILSDTAVTLGLDKAAFEDCLAKGAFAERVALDAAEAAAAGGQGTPHSIILVDGQQIPVEGAYPFETLKGLIDSILK